VRAQSRARAGHVGVGAGGGWICGLVSGGINKELERTCKILDADTIGQRVAQFLRMFLDLGGVVQRFIAIPSTAIRTISNTAIPLAVTNRRQ